MTKLALLCVIALTACIPDDEDPGVRGTDAGMGSGSGSGSGSGGASAVAGNPNLNQLIVAARSDEIVKMEPDLSAGEVAIKYGNFIGVDSMVVVGTTVYAGTEDNSVSATDLTTNELLWQQPFGYFELNQFTHPQVVERDGVIYAAGLAGKETAITLAGTTSWEYALSPNGPTDRLYFNVGKALVTDTVVFVGTQHNSSFDPNYLHAIDRATGARIWRIDLPQGMSGTPRIAGSMLLVPAGDLYAIDLSAGEVKWKLPADPNTIGAGTPTIVGDAVLVQSAPSPLVGRLYCLDLATGEIRWQDDVGNSQAGVFTPLAINGAVFGVYSSGSTIYEHGIPFLVDLATGNRIWSNERLSVSSSPVWANGRVYFNGQNVAGPGDVEDNVGLLMLDATTGALLAIEPYFYDANLPPIVIASNGVFTAAD